MHKKFLLAMATTALLASLLTGCGGTENDNLTGNTNLTGSYTDNSSEDDNASKDKDSITNDNSSDNGSSSDKTVEADKTEINPNDIPESPNSDFEYKYDAEIDGMVITKYIGKKKANIKIPSVIEDKMVVKLGTQAFRGSDVEIVIIPDGVTTIGDSTFDNCYSLTYIDIPNSVTSLSDNVFLNCKKLEYITLPNGITEIPKNAFTSCESLKSISIPDSVTSIGFAAFYGCNSLKTITLPENVENLGERALTLCESLEVIEVVSTNKYFTSENGILFNKDKSILLYYPTGKKDREYSVPNGVTRIQSDAFSNNIYLTSIILPDGVTDIGYSAFVYCENLESLFLPDSVSSVGKEPFSFCKKLTNITYKGTTYSYETRNDLIAAILH